MTPGGPDGRLRVLFLCTGNSGRSQMAEALLRHLTRGAVDVASAGSDPRPEIHPLARRAIRDLLGLEMRGQRPKSVADLGPAGFDVVISVCDRADRSCPVFPGDPERIRWSIEDPAEASGSEEERAGAFSRAAKDLLTRIRLWLSLPSVAARISAGERS